MSSPGKLILCLAVLFCALQVISARPNTDGMFLERVRYELDKKCSGVEKDMDKEMKNVIQKLTKEAGKLSKKVTNEDSRNCIESARLQANDDLEEKYQETQECVQILRDTLESTLMPEASVSDIMSFRQDFKNKLQICKTVGKADMKSVTNQFSIAGKKCMV